MGKQKIIRSLEDLVYNSNVDIEEIVIMTQAMVSIDRMIKFYEQQRNADTENQRPNRKNDSDRNPTDTMVFAARR